MHNDVSSGRGIPGLGAQLKNFYFTSICTLLWCTSNISILISSSAGHYITMCFMSSNTRKLHKLHIFSSKGLDGFRTINGLNLGNITFWAEFHNSSTKELPNWYCIFPCLYKIFLARALPLYINELLYIFSEKNMYDYQIQ